MLDYLCGSIDGLVNDQPNSPPVGDVEFRFQAMLAKGDPDAAARTDGAVKLLDDWPNVLAVGLAYSLANNSIEADQWYARACDKLESLDADRKRAAALDESPRR